MSDTITCPSGLKRNIRAIPVREERILTDRRLAKAGGQADTLLTARSEETLEAEPHDFGDTVINGARCSRVIASSRC